MSFASLFLNIDLKNIFDIFLDSYLFYLIYYYIAFQMLQNLYFRDLFQNCILINSKFFLYNIIYSQTSTSHTSFETIIDFIIFRVIFKVKFSYYIITLITKIIIFTYNFFPLVFVLTISILLLFPSIFIDVSNFLFFLLFFLFFLFLVHLF